MLSSHSLREETISFLQDMIRKFSPSGQEAGMAEVVEKKMSELGFDEIRRDEYDDVVGIRYGDRPGKRVLFDAHMDVVGVKNPETWSHDPTGGEISDGKIWGRGATDIKSGLAGFLTVLGRIPSSEFSGTLIASASISEETFEGGSLQKIIAEHRPDVVVISEPTNCELGIGHKGRASIYVDLPGKPAHSSSPHLGENAIYKAIDAAQRIRQMPALQDAELGDGVMELVEIISQPFPGESTVPYGCRLRYDRRLVRGETQESILKLIQAALQGLPGALARFVEVEQELSTGNKVGGVDFHPAWAVAADSDLVQRALKGIASTGVEPRTMLAPFCTNGSYSAGVAGIPTLLFGPSSIRLAHIVDEYIEVEELMKGVDGFLGLARVLGQA